MITEGDSPLTLEILSDLWILEKQAGVVYHLFGSLEYCVTKDGRLFDSCVVDLVEARERAGNLVAEINTFLEKYDPEKRYEQIKEENQSD